ncbi:serine/threonine-protein kinase pim-1 [Pangasianodon hypophthalmus]|uniref:serine/threonine-protein kinase pim-1 n=1 Tax=Pangasianodon hypophthalmus TaxID=310915 RepID=UPI0023070615|nr:serine/threonine-protein kinase pim-1 [Pangasianodon hypophthalmus]
MQQIFKLYHASRLAQAEFPDKALQYCDTITRAVISFPSSIKRSFIERLILLSNNVRKGEGEEPMWLLELCQLHRVKVADANANADREQNSTSTCSEVEIKFQNSESGSMSDETPALQSPDLELQTDTEVVFDSRYTMGELLGKGGFGSVYAGIRKEDGKEVAIKYVDKDHFSRHVIIPGETCELPVEVALMKIVSMPPRCSNVVELLEWFDMFDCIILVLERPSPCMDLREFCKLQNGRLSEAHTRDIMLQVVRAARHCCDRGVLHRDIKAQNLLINTETLQVKLIDFGCGDLLKDSPYRMYAGTLAFCPPEWVMFKRYEGIPATIWGLGVLLYNLVCGDYPFKSENDLEVGHLKLCPGVSRDFLDLMMWCLELKPDLRPSFEDVTRHEWFTDRVQDKVQIPLGTKDVLKQGTCKNIWKNGGFRLGAEMKEEQWMS